MSRSDVLLTKSGEGQESRTGRDGAQSLLLRLRALHRVLHVEESQQMFAEVEGNY